MNTPPEYDAPNDGMAAGVNEQFLPIIIVYRQASKSSGLMPSPQQYDAQR